MPPSHTQVLRLNTTFTQSFLATPMCFSSPCKSFELNLNLSSIGFVVVGFGSYHLIISLTTNTSLNFYKKSLVYAEQFIFQTLTGCLISMHLKYNTSRNQEYWLILLFVIIFNNTDCPLVSFGIVRLPHVT